MTKSYLSERPVIQDTRDKQSAGKARYARGSSLVPDTQQVEITSIVERKKEKEEKIEREKVRCLQEAGSECCLMSTATHTRMYPYPSRSRKSSS